jgi:glycosyltransferase involved in cell wall biosynthesis
MIKNPKITVYIPIYNYAKYADKGIKSVFNQTFKDRELIVFNDGSTDESEPLLRKYEHDPNITTVNQKNKRLMVTSHIALRLAKGKNIMRLDGDTKHQAWRTATKQSSFWPMDGLTTLTSDLGEIKEDAWLGLVS